MGMQKKIKEAWLEGYFSARKECMSSFEGIMENLYGEVERRFGEEMSDTIIRTYNVCAAKHSIENAKKAKDWKSVSMYQEVLTRLEAMEDFGEINKDLDKFKEDYMKDTFEE